MKKRILPLLLILLVFFALIRPIHMYGAVPLDPDAQASLTLSYQKDGIAFADLQISIYRIADAYPDGSFQLIEPYSSYPISIHDITLQEQWRVVAQTLCSYIVADSIEPDRVEDTDENGVAYFADLKTGLYFVGEVVADNTAGTYVFNQFLVYVPTPQPDDTFQYDVEANPKCTSFVPKTEYSVTKLWNDGGKQNIRPKEVTVDIYKDTILFETQILNTDNNWTYTWYVSQEDTAKWTVAERSVPNGYKVSIQENGGIYSIVNTYQSEPELPQTGDSFTPLPWMLAMCFCGIALLILGIHFRRNG